MSGILGVFCAWVGLGDVRLFYFTIAWKEVLGLGLGRWESWFILCKIFHGYDIGWRSMAL